MEDPITVPDVQIEETVQQNEILSLLTPVLSMDYHVICYFIYNIT